jgi:H+/Cl- antiporter ClcA
LQASRAVSWAELSLFFSKRWAGVPNFTHAFGGYYWFLPLSLLASALLTRYIAPDAEGHGTEKVIEAIHKRAGKIPVLVVPVKLVATIITLATGASARKEGPCASRVLFFA